MDRQFIARLNMLSLGGDMTSDGHGRAYILEELLAADISQDRRAIARRSWLALPAGLFLDGQPPSPAGVIPVTRRTYG
jgi:hypothetical protein